MFARTPRLLLRPGWPEDAPALHAEMAGETVVRDLARASWPDGLADAEAFLRRPASPGALPSLLILARTARAPVLVGGIALTRDAEDAIELGCWIARRHWGRGYATEAGRAVLDIADMLGIERLSAGHVVDNPAAGRVLAKLGFTPIGRIVARHSHALHEPVPTLLHVRRRQPSFRIAA